MLYKSFQNETLSLLGFGAMRLPQKEGQIDKEQVSAMVAAAIQGGINYFDTAWSYHGGLSEVALGEALAPYPRDSYYLADKFPGHELKTLQDPAPYFESQLKKCGTEYFDFYLLHNVCENSFPLYADPGWGLVDYLLEQKKAGRIRHLGFSSHARPECLKAFLELYGDKMEFCQIQLNYLDYELQQAKEKLSLLKQYKLPVWVMEPLRGGRLVNIPQEWKDKMQELRPEEGVPAWAFRYLQGIPQVHMVLSGMSDLSQLQENLRYFEAEKPLSHQELTLLQSLAGALSGGILCTGCGYCVKACPRGLSIPTLLREYKDAGVNSSFTVAMYMQNLPEGKGPESCIGCHSCERLCPQNIEIAKHLHDFAKLVTALPNWDSICLQRAKAAKAFLKV